MLGLWATLSLGIGFWASYLMFMREIIVTMKMMIGKHYNPCKSERMCIYMYNIYIYVHTQSLNKVSLGVYMCLRIHALSPCV